MYIFGGKDNSDTMLNDMWRLNLSGSNQDWEKVAYDAESVAPRGRQGHTMACYRNHIIVFGGLYEITRELNDLHIFNLKSGQWKRLYKTTNDEEAAKDKSQSFRSKKTKRDDSPETTGAGKLNSMLTRK